MVEYFDETYSERCQNYRGLWAIDPYCEFVRDLASGRIVAIDLAAAVEQRKVRDKPYRVTKDGTAFVDLYGPMTKGFSWFGGTATTYAAFQLRMAETDADVKNIMLRIDSPGGTVAGTADLGSTVRRVGQTKPVVAHVEDEAASAAYWVGSQASRLTMSPHAFAGSIGVFGVAVDSSEAAAQQGFKIHVLSSGKFKGAGVPGAEITDEQIAHWQHLVDIDYEHFVSAVAEGRGLDRKAVIEVADGRMFSAKEAKAAGLVDGIVDFETALVNVPTRTKKQRAREILKIRAAEHLDRWRLV